MLEVEAVKAALASGSTLANVAQQFGVTLSEVYGFAQEHDLKEQPTTAAERLQVEALRPAAQWERLIADDQECRVINGVDSRTTDGKVSALDIIRYYHGEARCYYTDEPTDLVMAADGVPGNLLVSNLVPIARPVLEERFGHTCNVIEDDSFDLFGPSGTFRVSVTTDHKLDKRLGAGMNTLLLHAAVDRLVRPYVQNYSIADILVCFGCPDTSVLFALWVWRQLEKQALLKGLARVKVERPEWPIAYVTKAAVLNQTQAMLQRQIGERVIATAQPAVMPPRGQGMPPATLIKL
jgi:hypothetical protein